MCVCVPAAFVGRAGKGNTHRCEDENILNLQSYVKRDNNIVFRFSLENKE